MAVLGTWRGVSKSFGADMLFFGIDFSVQECERIGLIGPNGTGKSTFLKILAEMEDADEGEAVIPKHVKVVYLPQEERFEGDLSIERVLEEASAADAMSDPESYGRIRKMIGKAGFPDMAVAASSLSGGWQKRLSIVKALVRLPDLLLMDEPTNHLDLEGILWLETMLSGGRMATITVSHDRRFLSNTTDRIVELGRFYPDGYFSVMGDYDTFREKKAEFLEQQEQMEARLANRMRREQEWLSRMPKARATKAQYRIDEAERLRQELSRVRARNRMQENMSIRFESTDRKTRKLVEVYKAGKAMGGRELFSGVTLLLSPGTRLGLAGQNGTGKTTFMRLLADELAPDSGTVKHADGLQMIYFDQARESIDPSLTLKQALSPDGDSVVFGGRSLHVVTWAKKFLFSPEQLEQPVAKLSGGEKARILIANLMRRPADVLLLDEPTNDLDIPALEVLEESLMAFPGAVVLVSHDRYFANRVCQKTLGFGEGKAELFADMDQWIGSVEASRKKALAEERQKEKAAARPGRVEAAPKKPTKLSYKFQLELDGMEERILEAEERLAGLTDAVNDPAVVSDPARLAKTCEELESAQSEVDGLYVRWEELEAMKNGDA